MCKEPLYLSEKPIRFLAGEDHILNQPYGHMKDLIPPENILMKWNVMFR